MHHFKVITYFLPVPKFSIFIFKCILYLHIPVDCAFVVTLYTKYKVLFFIY